MASIKFFTQLAMELPEAEEHPHFEKKSYRTRKKIFATLDEIKQRVVVKLKPEDQFIYCRIDPTVIYPVEGNWGIKGWTMIELKKIKQPLLKEIVALAYKTVRS
ncbi:MmcQ/YjbR family DNA-binding protein [Pollutibacter soli]|uniref:MmcQ/YjbR family DNA-binding protein n=1 Tax=Pollutibacter soli TaxID=3034157 RepID=UPI0030133ADC